MVCVDVSNLFSEGRNAVNKHTQAVLDTSKADLEVNAGLHICLCHPYTAR